LRVNIHCAGTVICLFAVFCFTSVCNSQEHPAEAPSTKCAKEPSDGSAACNAENIEPKREVVVVTGTLVPLPLGEVDRSVSVIQLQEAPLLYEHWVDYLQSDPSVDYRQRAPNDVQGDISIRGTSFGQTLIMVNGLRMDDAQSSHHDMDLPLPTESLSRIEILRGPGSTFYGSDAMGGAVNFIPALPVRSELRLRAGIGNFGIHQQSALASFSTKHWGEQLSVARDFSSGFAADRDYRSSTIFSESEATTMLGHTSVMLAYGDKPFGANGFYGPFDSWERTKTWFAGLKQDLGNRMEFDLGYRRHSDEFILLRDRPQVYENNHITESWQAALRLQESIGKKATLSYGGEGDHDAIDSNNLGQRARSRGAGYADLDMRALGRFSLSLGAREELFDSGRTQFSPTVAGGVWLKAGLKLRASASSAFRLPTYTDLFYHDPANTGNPNLRPESAWNYEGGLQWNHGDRFKADITVFHLREKNVIDYVQYFLGDLYHAANIQRLNFTGLETSVDLRIADGHRLTIGYTGLHGAQQALNGLTSRYVFNYPINNAVVGWQGKLPHKFVARTRVGATERFGRNPYAVWDIDFGRQFRNVGTSLSFSNVTNTRYQEIKDVALPSRAVVFAVEYEIARKGR
jgi:iron complex outermembrane receptor protein